MALTASGHMINLVVTRNGRSARRAAMLLKTKGLALGPQELHEIPLRHRTAIQQSDVVLITTPDDAIPRVANQLAKLLELRPRASSVPLRRPLLALHTSGALTSEVLNPVRERGVAIGSMHPLISIGSQTSRPPTFSDIHFSLEGDAAAVRVGKQLVRDLGGDSFVIDARTKPLYHAAALMASPNLTALVDIAIEMMTHCGISSSRARQILLPLIESTVQNLAREEPRLALTGTFKRGDVDTVRVHLAAIASERLTDALRAYATLGKRSLTMSGIPKSRKRAIETLIAEATTHSLEATMSLPTKRKPLASKSTGRR